MASWALLLADPSARASPARTSARNECNARADEEREEEGADQTEKSAGPCRNSTVPRIAALRAHRLVGGGWWCGVHARGDLADKSHECDASGEHASDERRQGEEAHRKAAARFAPEDSKRITTIKGGEDERLPRTTCGQRAVAEEPHHRPAIEGADLLQDDARGECWRVRRKFCDQCGCCSLPKGASRCDELGNAPFPLALNNDKAVAEQLGINFNGRAGACDEKLHAAHCAFKFAPGVAFAHEDALATIDQWTVILIVKRFSRINAPLYGEVAVFTNEQRLFW
jgi:hypothetical protein